MSFSSCKKFQPHYYLLRKNVGPPVLSGCLIASVEIAHMLIAEVSWPSLVSMHIRAAHTCRNNAIDETELSVELPHLYMSVYIENIADSGTCLRIGAS